MALAENPRESSTIIDGATGGRSRRLFNSFPQRFEAPFEAELEHFVDCLDGELIYTFFHQQKFNIFLYLI